jgi:hypothetical protein
MKFLPKSKILSFLACICVLQACGGGTSGGDSSSVKNNVTYPPNETAVSIVDKKTRQPPETLVQDLIPPQAPENISGLNLFPLNIGDVIQYSTSPNNLVFGYVESGTLGVDSRIFNLKEGGSRLIETEQYIKDKEGLKISYVGTEGMPQNVQKIIGSLLLLPAVLPEVNSSRRSIREGSWGEDLNGDGIPEGFKFEFTQHYGGFVNKRYAGVTSSVAKFENTITVKLIFSDPELKDIDITSVEDSYYAENFGPIEVNSKTFSSDSNISNLHLTAYEAQVNNFYWRDYLFSDGQLIRTDALPRTLAYSQLHKKYYGLEKRGTFDETGYLVSVNSLDGAVSRKSFSSSPEAFAMSKNGEYAYISFRFLGEIQKILLTDMSVVARYNIPESQSFSGGSILTFANDIVIDPLNSNKIYATLMTAESPGYKGIAVFEPTIPYKLFAQTLNSNGQEVGLYAQKMFLGPKSNQFFTFGSRILAEPYFSSFAFDNDHILVNHTRDVFADLSFYYPSDNLTVTNNGSIVLLNNGVYDSNTLALIKVLDGQACFFVNSTTIGCFNLSAHDNSTDTNLIVNNDTPRFLELHLFNATNFSLQKKIRVDQDLGLSLQERGAVLGPKGQIAYKNQDGVRLFNNVLLQ